MFPTPFNDILMRLRQRNMYQPVPGQNTLQAPMAFEGGMQGGYKMGGPRFPGMPNPLNALNGLNKFGAFYGQGGGRRPGMMGIRSKY